MSGFEEYQKKQDKEEFYTGQIDKGVDVSKASYDYDPDQLIEHLKKKTDDKSAEAFALRTKYYFQDDQAITAKIRRYQKINQRGENQDKVDEYAERYTHHSAKHRKWAAETASIKFMDAQNLAREYKNDENANSLVKYRHRKEIMNQRMEALESVAYVKAQSKKHEKYLVARSKLSCNLILKDQLDHFIAEESSKQNNDDMVNSLKAELTKVETEITKSTKTIRENVPKSHEKWRDVNGINDRKYTQNMNIYRREECIGCSKNSAILMTELELFNAEQKIYEWPKKSVIKDQGGLGAPISQAEKENLEWNTKYGNANANEKLKMEAEALKRFLEMPVPSAEVIKGSKAKNYVITNLRDYYDLTKRALPYYQKLLSGNENVNNPIAQVIKDNPSIQAKIGYVAALDKYIDYRLRRDHLIVYDSETKQYSFENEDQYKYTRGFFGPKRTKKYGDDENGRSESADRFTALMNAFDTYNAAPAINMESLNNISQNLNINIQPQNIINEPLNIVNEPQNIVIQPQVIEENQIDKNGKEEINKANNLVKNMINLFDNKGKKIEQNQEEKKEEKPADGFLYYEENGKKYRVTPKEDQIYLSFHEKQNRITRREFNSWIINRQVVGLKLHKEYQVLYDNCTDEVKSFGNNSNTASLDRDLQALMKPVVFDAKGQPLTDEDKKNHQWNLDWLNCWQKGKVDNAQAEKMIAEYLPHVYENAGELLKILSRDSNDPEALQADLSNYFEKLLDNENELKSFLHMASLDTSIDNMRRKIPFVKDFIDKNPQYSKMGDILNNVKYIMTLYVENAYGMNIEKDADGVFDEKQRTARIKSNMKTYPLLVQNLGIIYGDYKEKIEEKNKAKKDIKEDKKEENIINENVIIVEKKEENKTGPKYKTVKAMIRGTFNDAYSVNKSQRLLRAYTKGRNLKVFKSPSFGLDKELAPLLNSLHYKVVEGGKEKGETPEDEKIIKENEAWAILWTSNNGDKPKKREEMIAQKLPHIFDGVSLPTVEELKNKTLFDLKDEGKRLFEIFNLIRKVNGLDSLAFESATAKEIINQKDFQQKVDAVKALEKYLMNYIASEYSLIENDGVMASFKSKDIVATDSELFDLIDVYGALLKKTQKKKEEKKKEEKKEQKKEVKDEKRENKNKINVINENVINENVIVDINFMPSKDIAEFKKRNPDISDKAIKLINDYRKATAYNECPEYLSLLEKTGKGFKGNVSKASLDRVASYVMRPVMFDENYNVIQTEENIANHKWNIKWLKAWENLDDITEKQAIERKASKTKKAIKNTKLTDQEKKDLEEENIQRRKQKEKNEQIIKEMIEEENEKMWEGFDMPPISKTEKLEGKELSDYRKELENWIDAQLEKDPIKYFTLAKKFTAADNLAKQSKYLRRVFKKDSTKYPKENFIINVNTYGIFYLSKKYHIDIEALDKTAVWPKDEISNREMNAGAQLDIFSMTAGEAGAEYKKAVQNQELVIVDALKLKQAHDQKSVIKNIKADLELKKDIANEFTKAVNTVTDEKIALRRKVDINDKKMLDFKTFEDMSAFGTLFDNKDDLSKYCNKYGQGLKKQKEGKDGKTEIFEVIDKLKDIIFKFDLNKINLSSDEDILVHAPELEKMSGAVTAFQNLLKKNPDYLVSLSEENVEKAKNKAGDEGKNKVWVTNKQLVDHMEKLSAVTSYYRIRKLVITDDLYASKLNSDISYQTSKKDGTQMRRLKKMMRASYVAALSLNRLLGKKVPGKPDIVPESETEKIMLESLYKDNSKLHAGSKLDALRHVDMQITRLENERLFQAPVWLQNALTLDPSKIPDVFDPKVKDDPFLCIGGNQAEDVHVLKVLEQESHASELDKKREKVLEELCGGKGFKDAPRFMDGTNKYLEKIDVSDHWQRTRTAFVKEYVYGKSDEEILEITELLSIQRSKEWTDTSGKKHSKNWSDIAKDEDAKAFYESAFKEMAKKLIFSVYAAGKRVAETVAIKVAILHPTDLVLQMTQDLRDVLTNVATISNIVDNLYTKNPRQENVKKLFEGDDAYNLDIDDLMHTSGLVSSLDFKMNQIGKDLIETSCKYGADGDDEFQDLYDNKSKAIFGDPYFFEKVVKKEVEEYTKKHPPINGQLDGHYSIRNNSQLMTWYFNRHPEYINKKSLNAKVNNKGVFDNGYSKGYLSNFENNEKFYADTIRNKTVDIPSDEEMTKYEKHLVKEKYPKVRLDYEADLEVVSRNLFNPNEKITLYDPYKKPVGEATKKMILNNRKKDPYGIKLFKTGFEELNYEDKDGKMHFRVGL